MPLLNAQNRQIAYESSGHPLNPCIILISGLGGQLISWPDSLVQRLVERHFYVIQFDNRDVGLSSYYDHLPTPEFSSLAGLKEKGQAPQVPYTLQDMAQDVLVLIDHLEINQAHIVGQSMGGIIAQLLALEHRERVASLTCIYSTTGELHLPPPQPAVLNCLMSKRPPAENVDIATEQALKLYQIYNPSATEADLQSIKTRTQAAYERAYHPTGIQRQLLAMAVTSPRGNRLRQLSLPSLVIHGKEDPVFSIEHGEYLAECLRGSLLTFDQMGHGLPVHLYHKIADAIAR